MTRKEAIEILSTPFHMKSTPQDVLDAHKMAIEALEQDQQYKSFCEWVAKEIFSENWVYVTKDTFAEIACRKLNKLGMVTKLDDYWELVESDEE